MGERARIDFACNDPDNGNFAGRVCMIHLPNGALELTANAWGITSFRGCPKFGYALNADIRLSGRQWPTTDRKCWYGNWCWDAHWFEAAVAHEFLEWVRHRGMFHCEGGLVTLCDAWEAPEPLPKGIFSDVWHA